MTPTCGRPDRRASRALVIAESRPDEVGSETRTSVQPLLPRGHSIRVRRVAWRRRGAVVPVVRVGTVGAAPVVGAIAVVATVGSGAVSPTTVVAAALLASRVHQIAP